MSDTTSLRRAAGFSLIELMISIVIGMLALVFATRLFATSEQSKNVSMGASDAMQNGMQALFSISQDAAQAGWGLNDDLIGGCNTVFSDTKGFVLPTFQRSDGVTVSPMAAVVIKANGEQPDSITLMSGSSPTGTGAVGLSEKATSGASSAISDRVAFAFRKDDAVLFVPLPVAGGATRCALAQLSANPTTTDGRDTLPLAQGDGARFNRSGGIGVDYNANEARIFNLGPAATLSLKTWTVKDGFLQLRASNLAGASTAPQSVIDNVVSIKAQYGFDTRGTFNLSDGTAVGKWSSDMYNADSSPVTGDQGDFRRIVALRLAIVARSKQPDRPDAAGKCKTTTVKPVVFAEESPRGVTTSPQSVDVAVTGDRADWTCYRYRVFETVVQLRNLSWRPTAEVTPP